MAHGGGGLISVFGGFCSSVGGGLALGYRSMGFGHFPDIS